MWMSVWIVRAPRGQCVWTQVALSAVSVPWALTWRVAAVVRKVSGQLSTIKQCPECIKIFGDNLTVFALALPCSEDIFGHFYRQHLNASQKFRFTWAAERDFTAGMQHCPASHTWLLHLTTTKPTANQLMQKPL